jgi:hypothetical protein
MTAYWLRSGPAGRGASGRISRNEGLRFLGEAGFAAQAVPFHHSELAPGEYEVFVGVKPM